MSIADLLKKREELIARMKAIQGKAAGENRPMSDEDLTQFNQIDEEVVTVDKMLNDEKRLETRENTEIFSDDDRRDLERSGDDFRRRHEDKPEPVRLDRALSAWFRAPCADEHAPTNDELEQARSIGLDPSKKVVEIVFPHQSSEDVPRTVGEARQRYRDLRGRGGHLRAQGTDTGGAGGFITAETFLAAIDIALLQFGGMRNVSTIVRTMNGDDWHHPTVNDTSNTGEWIGQNPASGVSQQDITFSELVLYAHNSSSKELLVSYELLEDTNIDLLALIGRLLGERLGRLHNTAFTVGDGAAKPNGLIPSATSSGVTTASNTAYTFQEILQLKHSVDPSYRGMGASFMGNDTTLRIMKSIVDSQSRPIWMPNLIDGEPDRFDGTPFQVNQDFASGASAKALAYGQMPKYLIREVNRMRLLRLDELYAEKNQVAFLAFMRVDGGLLDAGTNPVKYFTNAA